jgi:hypothetical protein
LSTALIEIEKRHLVIGSFNPVLEQEIHEWNKFRRALRKEDQQFLDRLFEKARLHVEAGNNASRLWPFEAILTSM